MDDPLGRFTGLYDTCYRNVLRYAVLHGEPGFAEDVASEVFLIAWRQLPAVPEPALPWLLGVARNLLRKQAGPSRPPTAAALGPSDGGRTWQYTTPVSRVPSTPLTVSCAAVLDCFVTVFRFSKTVPSRSGLGGYEDATIEATRHGGATWTTIATPTVGGASLATVFPLSCPSPAGCIAVAATPRQEDLTGQREVISSFPATGNPMSGG